VEREKRKGRNEKEKGRKEREKYMGRGGGAARQAKGKSLNPARVSEADTKKEKKPQGHPKRGGNKRQTERSRRDPKGLGGREPGDGVAVCARRGFFLRGAKGRGENAMKWEGAETMQNKR